jgi:hypothetical protein
VEDDKPRKSLFSITEDGNVEIDLSKGSSSPPPPGKRAESLAATIKGWGAFIAAVGAFAAALSSLYKPVQVDTVVSKAAYDSLAQDVKVLGEQNGRTHDDLVALRAYLDGTLHTLGYSQEHAARPVPSMSLADAAAKSLSKPQTIGSSPAWKASTAVALPPVQAKVPDPPAISERPSVVAPPSYEALVASARAPSPPAPKR